MNIIYYALIKYFDKKSRLKMDNLSELYNVIKTFLPFANQYLTNSPLEPYLPKIENLVNTIDSMGGIDTLSSLMNSFKKNNNIPTNNIPSINNYTEKQITTHTNYLKPIDSYKRIN